MNNLNWLKEITDNTDLDQSVYQTIQNLSSLILEASQWLKTTDSLNKKLKKQFGILQKDKDLELFRAIVSEKDGSINYSLTKNGLKSVINRFTQLKRKISTIHNIEDIQNHYVRGYEILYQIRDMFGDPIKYQLLYQDEDKSETLIETTMPLEIFTKALTFRWNEIGSRATMNEDFSNLLTLTVNNSHVKNLINSIDNITTDMGVVVNNIKRQSLYDSIVAYRDKHELDKFLYNYGRIYEVYNILVNDLGNNDYDKINYIGKNQEKLIESLLKSTSGENIRGIAGGDYEDKQLKAVWNSAADVASSTNIIDNLRKIVNAFYSIDRESIKKDLSTVFFGEKNSVNNRIDKNIQDNVHKKIDEIINTLFDIK